MFTQDVRNLYLTLELIISGELFTFLRRVGRFPVDQALIYIAQIICIFEYLHNKDIIFLDLKPENILLHKSGYLKLTDFCFTKVIEGLLYEMIVGIDPFNDDDLMMFYQKILKEKIKFPSGFDSNAKKSY